MRRLPRGLGRSLTAMLLMAGGGSLSLAPPALAQAPMYKTPIPAGLMVERWKETGNPNDFFARHGGDLRHELWLASREDKHGLLIFFRGGDNAYADLMKDTVLRNEEAQSYFKARLRTIVLDKSSQETLIDLKGDTVTEARLATELGVTRSPSFVFIDLYGEKRYLHPRPIFDAGRLIEFARCMAEGVYGRNEVERSLRGG